MADALVARYGIGRDGHSHFAPSAAARWLNCAGSLIANIRLGDMAGEDAAYGTVAHGLAEVWRHRGRPDHLIGTVQMQDGYAVQIDADMLDYVQQFIDWCDELPGEHFVEQKLDLSAYLPITGQTGTCDHLAIEQEILTVTDLKMGTGYKVLVEGNEQAMCYALAAFEEWDWLYNFQTIVIRICQPRLRYFGVWRCSRKELQEFGERVRERSALAWQEDAPRTPGLKQCKWCKVVGCAAVSEHLDALVDDVFEGEDANEMLNVAYLKTEMDQHRAKVEAGVARTTLIDAEKASTAFLASRLRYRKLYEAWFRAMYEELLDRHSKGEQIPGWDVKDGRRSFAWVDNDEAAKLLLEEGVDPYQTSVISVAAARKVLKAARYKPKQIETLLAGIVLEKPGKPTLVPVGSDDRQNSEDAVDEAFGEDQNI